MNAPAQRQTDPLSERLGRLRTARRDPGWAQELLELGRELTMAEAGVVLARAPAGWEAIAPRTGDDPPEAWSSLAGEAADGRGIAAGRAGPDGRWVFAVAIGAADQAARPAVLVLQVAASIAMDLVLTRERMAFLGALAEAAGAEAAAQARAPLTLAAAVAEAMLKPADRQEGLHQAAALLHAAGLPGAERVAIVLPRAGTLALSDQAQHDAGAELPRRLMALAQEATDRGAPRRAMPGEAPTPAERSFAERFGPRPLIIVPAPDGRAVVIVILPPGSPVADGAEERLVPAATLLGAIADGQRRRPGVRRRWIVAGAVAAALLVLALLPRAAVVEAPIVLRPDHAQMVTAPFDGILEASEVQPGDTVRRDETPLARLATREVQLELAAARARVANDLRDAAVARAAGQPAQEQISLLSARRAEAQLALLEHRLRLADIRAPADGVVTAGDLRRSIGQPLTRGQVLFEIALPGPLRAEVLVLDEDSTRIREGQPVRFAVAAEPGRVREAVVERIRPMAEVVDGRNVFRVVARLTDAEVGDLRPGMEGWARIETHRTSWLAAVLHDPVRWVRRRFWF
jgi:multidrug efflux pump subunit AcrA (membrane-fusion protein)